MLPLDSSNISSVPILDLHVGHDGCLSNLIRQVISKQKREMWGDEKGGDRGIAGIRRIVVGGGEEGRKGGREEGRRGGGEEGRRGGGEEGRRGGGEEGREGVEGRSGGKGWRGGVYH